MIRRVALELALPIACLWVKQQERAILRRGLALDPAQLEDARRLGVRRPERVRIRVVDEVPAGLHPLLRRVGGRLGMVSPLTVGMSLRYGIMMRADCWPDRHILAHELAHTVQYERLGGIGAFLRRYLRDCASHGYANSLMEIEAEDMAARAVYRSE